MDKSLKCGTFVQIYVSVRYICQANTQDWI